MSYILELLDRTGNKVAQLMSNECSVKIRRTINSEWSITINYPIPPEGQGIDKSEYFNLWKVRARIINTENLNDKTTFVLQKPELDSSSGRVELVITGEHLCIDIMRSEVVNGHLDIQELPAYHAFSYLQRYSSIDINAEDIATLVTVKISWETVLSAFQKILSACSAEYGFDETNNEIVIKKSVGSSNKYILVQSGRNLNSLKVVSHNQNVINKLYGVGTGEPPSTIAGARHKVTAKSEQTITLDSNKVVPEDGSWNGYKVKAEDDELFTITDSKHQTDKDALELSGDLSGISVGDYLVICDSYGDPVNYIIAGTSISLRGAVSGVYKSTKYDNTINLIKNPEFSESGSWNNIGSIVSANFTTDYVVYGTRSLKINTVTIDTGTGQTVNVKLDRYYYISVKMYLVSGAARLVIIMNNQIYKLGAVSSAGWHELTAKIKARSSSVDVQVRSALSTNTEFHIDSAIVAECELINNDLQEKPFVVNCGQIGLWYETFDNLIKLKDPVVEYQAKFVDLYRMSPEDFPFDKIEIGDYVTITDDNIGIRNKRARITEINIDPFNPELTEHTITTGV